jgi:hypothetical protein
MPSPSTPVRSSGPGGMLRFVAIFSILAFAGLGFLTVLGALTFEDFGQLAIRLAMMACIAGAASIAIWALMLRRR